MKKSVLISGICFELILSFLLLSCTEVQKGQFSTDDMPPSVVSNVSVVNGAGTVLLNYELPEEDDLLYVRAKYTLDDGRPMEVLASAYRNELTVEGFGKAGERVVQLTCVDRSGNESLPTSVTVKPEDSPIYKIAEEMKASSDFGGIRLDWENPKESVITITVKTPNEVGQLITVKKFYSQNKSGYGYVRGQSTETSEVDGKRFFVELSDHWGNTVQVIDNTFYPVYEIGIPTDRFANYQIPGAQNPSNYSGSTYAKLWNGIWLNDDNYHTTTNLAMPINIGIDLGRPVKLSRLKYHQRTGSNYLHAFGHGNPKQFRVYGVLTTAGTQLNITQPNNAWVLLSEFTSFKPSGLPLGSTTADDRVYACDEGEEVMIPTSPDVRYIRVEVLNTWSGTKNFCHIAELEFFGKLTQ